ncbi:uncharacterized protein LOC134184706 [Corticium candelabrum]|uniref:uncharacterized protein LOC134184706 n=1 Tax=Corticium candelabrum TaxID=121492 RepID=UPI002E25C0CE|nr:uncharacterized protein LOC134184706 [Corticium candelabrum]
MKFQITAYVALLVSLLVTIVSQCATAERLPEIGSNVCQSWKFDVIDGEYKEYLGNVLIDVENSGQGLGRFGVYLNCRWGNRSTQLQRSSKYVHIQPGHRSTVTFHVRLPISERNQEGKVRHRCFYRVVAQPGERRSRPCFVLLKAEYGSFLQSCTDKERKVYVSVQRDDELIKVHFSNHKHESIIETDFNCSSNPQHNFHEIVWLLASDDLQYNIDLEVDTCNVTSSRYLADHNCSLIIKRHCLQTNEILYSRQWSMHNKLGDKCKHPVAYAVAESLAEIFHVSSHPVAVMLAVSSLLLVINIITFASKCLVSARLHHLKRNAEK